MAVVRRAPARQSDRRAAVLLHPYGMHPGHGSEPGRGGQHHRAAHPDREDHRLRGRVLLRQRLLLQARQAQVAEDVHEGLRELARCQAGGELVVGEGPVACRARGPGGLLLLHRSGHRQQDRGRRPPPRSWDDPPRGDPRQGRGNLARPWRRAASRHRSRPQPVRLRRGDREEAGPRVPGPDQAGHGRIDGARAARVHRGDPADADRGPHGHGQEARSDEGPGHRRQVRSAHRDAQDHPREPHQGRPAHPRGRDQRRQVQHGRRLRSHPAHCF